MPGTGFNYQTSETMTNGVMVRNFATSTAGAWQFKVYWQGDAQYNSVYSNVVTVNWV